MPDRKSFAEKHCTSPGLGEGDLISLPVLATDHRPIGTVRKSRSGRRRAWVLAVVQVLLIGHISLWLLSREYGWWGGRTTTPIEPSESMEFFKHGVINAGLIFFAVALLSTLVLGRWFCGWGCHLVLLQDLCGWMMKRVGVRPKPFRSRLLIYVPLILAVYMFLWPAFYRLAIAPWTRPNLEWPGFSVHLTTTEFWRTFTGVAVAIPFLLICGFATVYFLGAKGFCTYGCPYGGFFAPFDEFAVGRIRVTDACHQCGHCTAVCTSNVRVHEEVREYGMVVDPGCMKCLDCVSVCPNDALYFGLGRPAQLKGEPRKRAPVRKYDLTWPEEIGFGLVFLLAFASIRGVYDLIPMLMAAGAAGVVTFVAWKLWRLLRDSDVSLHRAQLKLRGRVQRPGWWFATFAAVVLLLTAHCGVVNAAETAGRWYNRKITMSLDAMLSESPPALPPEEQRAADRALVCYRIASPLGDGGIGLIRNPRIDLHLAQIYCYRHEFARAETHLERAIRRAGGNEQLSAVLVGILGAQSRYDEALAHLRQTLVEHPEFTALVGLMGQWCRQFGFLDQGIEICRARLERGPDAVTMRVLALLLIDRSNLDEGIALIRQAMEMDPETAAESYPALAMALAQQGKGDEAVAAMEEALKLAPDDRGLLYDMAGLLQYLGRTEEARKYLDRVAPPEE